MAVLFTRLPTKREINYRLPTGKILTNGHGLSKADITLGCNQMINLRGMKNCYPCIECKLCELINEHLLLICFLIINLDLPTKVENFNRQPT